MLIKQFILVFVKDQLSVSSVKRTRCNNIPSVKSYTLDFQIATFFGILLEAGSPSTMKVHFSIKLQVEGM